MSRPGTSTRCSTGTSTTSSPPGSWGSAIQPEPRNNALLREQQLVQRLRRGDERAFAELVRATQDRVYRLLYRMLGDREEAADLTQDVYLTVYNSLGHFRGDSRLSTWICRIAKNLCLNRLSYLAKRARGQTADLASVGMDATIERIQPSRTPDDAVAQGEQRRMVEQALGLLEPEQRLVVILRDIEELSYEEITELTELPLGTVKSRLHRGRLALAAIIERMEGMTP